MSDDLRQLEFQQCSDLIDAIKWVSTSGSKALGAGDAREFTSITLLERDGSGSQLAEVVEYNNGNAWLGRFCPCTGVLPGTQYLVDGRYIKANLGGASTQRKSPLVMMPTELTTVRLFRVNNHNKANIKAGSCIEANAYPGDLADFQIPDDPSILVASVADGFKLRRMASYNILCSFKKEGTSSKTTEAQKVFLVIDNNYVTLTSLEKNGKRGHLIASTRTPAFVKHPLSLIFEGVYLRKAVDVFNNLSTEIRIYVDNLDNPKRISFLGAGGFANLELVDSTSPVNQDNHSIFSLCNYIQGFSKHNPLGMEVKSEIVAEYVFDIEYFLSEFATQMPHKTKKMNEADDMILEMVDNTMHIYKKANVQKRQLAVVPTDSIYNKGKWLKCQIKFPHMHDALKSLVSYVRKEDETAKREGGEEYVPDFMELDDDLEGEDYDLLDFGYEINANLAANETTHTFTLRQTKRTIGGANEVYDLFLESNEFPDFKVRVWMNPLAIVKEVKNVQKDPE